MNKIIFLLLLPLYFFSQKDTLRVKYNIQATGIYNQGNNNNIVVNSNNSLVLEKTKIRNSTIYNYNYGIQTDVTNQNEHFFNNAFSYKFNKKFNVVTLIEAERSFMRLIDIRGLYGIGCGYQITKWLSISDLFSIDKTNYNDGSTLLVGRNSLRIKVNWTKNKFNFNTETYIQPDMESKYFRFRTNTNISYKLHKSVSLVISSQDSYEQFVVNNRKNNDFNLSIGISISN
jgi:hypothetical protein